LGSEISSKLSRKQGERFERAALLHQAGNAQEALHEYRRLLRELPAFVPLLTNYSLLLLSADERSEAIPLLKRSLLISPAQPEAWTNLALALVEEGALEEALNAVDRALKMLPGAPNICNARAIVLSKLQRFDEALVWAMRSLDASPRYCDALNNAGMILSCLSRGTEALPCFEQVLNLDPTSVKAWLNKAIALEGLTRFDEAGECYAQALKYAPDLLDAHKGRARMLVKTEGEDGALAYMDRELACRLPQRDYVLFVAGLMQDCRRHDLAEGRLQRYLDDQDDAMILNQLGHLLFLKGEIKAALPVLDRAVQIEPDAPDIHMNRAVVLGALGESMAARDALARVLVLHPDFPEAECALSYLHLSLFEFEKGWQGYEARWQVAGNTSPRLYGESRQWNGEPFEGRLLIWKEQGLGDQILHGTLLKKLEGMVSQVVLLVDPRLVPVYQRTFPSYRCISVDDGVSDTSFDQQLPIASLGRVFQKTITDFPSVDGGKFLALDAAKVDSVRARLDDVLNGRLKIGLSWRSSNLSIGERKSIDLDGLHSILTMENAVFIDLQYGDTEVEKADFFDKYKKEIFTLPGLDKKQDIDGLLSLIETCDLVLTTSNSTAHLAGALGKETLLMLPFSLGRFWYWQQMDGRSLWYPMVKVFAQRSLGDWGGVIDDVKQYLGEKYGL
jgi:tetratricopeptide (TPR) repeat protein